MVWDATRERRAKKQAVDKRYYDLCHYLLGSRERGRCAMVYVNDCLGQKLRGFMQAVAPFHHIEKRSHGRIDEPWNLLGCCVICHAREENRYEKYPPKGQEFCLKLAKDLNLKNNIAEVWDGN